MPYPMIFTDTQLVSFLAPVIGNIIVHIDVDFTIDEINICYRKPFSFRKKNKVLLFEDRSMVKRTLELMLQLGLY